MKSILFTLLIVISAACNSQKEIQPNSVVPTAKQIEYQEMELIGFIHFTVNTFTDKEWGYGDEDPQVFNPLNINVDQWVKTAKDAGMKELILTSKHHDGFCLWPSAYTEHSIKNSPYKNGKGDILREFTNACHKYGIKPGFYLSPWDRNHPKYGSPEYIEYYKNQLAEILTNYGEIFEIWFDGANGGDGYYGSAKETRKIDPRTYYPWKELAEMVYKLQPKASIFSDAGPDVHWIGNEKGFSGETFWSTINADSIIIGKSDASYLNKGDANGKNWVIGVCDVSIRPGWFYHQSEDSLVRTPQNLVDLYYKSVGRNAVMLLNIPPDRNGLLNENDIHSLKEFREILDETFKDNLALNAKVTVSGKFSKKYAPENITDIENKTFWAAEDGAKTGDIEIKLDGTKEFDRILIQEPIQLGQRISSFEVQAFISNSWQTIATGTTIGYKRLLQIPVVKTDKIKILIKEANNVPSISNVALYKASGKEQLQKYSNL